ncbi:hypothetical protein GCM10007063_12900 [Lentibacillus kapialis]|uniref:Uncharacterized protein n=1 Tax=Lentibacillus kapialis TaxID=340214 RepID=A0A917PU43_9BACI|nr:hypothetical protein [Lentibacillus kapialis]GGJ91698.1 hypothetical protein GCM10007063_12900 [Lentibacillus kapialis]
MKKFIVSLGVVATLLLGVLPFGSTSIAGDQPIVNYDPDLGDLM